MLNARQLGDLLMTLLTIGVQLSCCVFGFIRQFFGVCAVLHLLSYLLSIKYLLVDVLYAEI